MFYLMASGLPLFPAAYPLLTKSQGMSDGYSWVDTDGDVQATRTAPTQRRRYGLPSLAGFYDQPLPLDAQDWALYLDGGGVEVDIQPAQRQRLADRAPGAGEEPNQIR